MISDTKSGRLDLSCTSVVPTPPRRLISIFGVPERLSQVTPYARLGRPPLGLNGEERRQIVQQKVYGQANLLVRGSD